MFQNSCTRITACAALMLGSALLSACSASDPQTSPPADKPAVPVAAQTTPPPPADTISPPSIPAVADAPPGQSKTSGAAAMKMFIDPVTGLPRDPTDAELAAMTQAEQSQKSAAQKPAREIKLKKRGVAMKMEDNEAPLQSCVTPDGIVVDHD